MDNSIDRKRRYRIRISVLLLAVFGASSPLPAADETILPHGWSPSVTDEVDYFKSELETEQAQQGINRLTGHISSLLDAELCVRAVHRIAIMSTYVFLNIPAHGHINPMLPIVRELLEYHLL